MSRTDDLSPGGSRVIRHEPRERSWAAPAASTGIVEIERHFAAHVGEVSTVFHEIVSDLVHLDVHVIEPRPERNWWTLFTTGMSDRPMTTEHPDQPRFAELVLSLPPAWRVDLLQATPPAADLETWYWPIRWMKTLARLPHEYGTWLGSHHTVPNGDPPEPFAPGTRLCCWLLLPPLSLPEDARQVALADGRRVSLLAMHALYQEEMRLKLEQGADVLLEAFDRADLSEVLAPQRPPVLRRRRFGLF